MNTETKHTPEALAAASAIRKLNTIEADTLLALFDTGKQDREACEQLIVGKFAEVIDRETKLPEIAQLKADKLELVAAITELVDFCHAGHSDRGLEAKRTARALIAKHTKV